MSHQYVRSIGQWTKPTEDNVDDGSARLVTSSKVALLVAGEGVQALAGSWLWCGALGELDCGFARNDRITKVSRGT